MSFIAWNCREFRNLRIGKELEVVIGAKDPFAVFIVKTWVDEVRLKDVQRQIDFDNLFFVERNNRGGVLALYWRNSIDLSIDTLILFQNIILMPSSTKVRKTYGDSLHSMVIQLLTNGVNPGICFVS